MIDFEVHTHIDRTPGEVFAYATDPSKLATWQTNTVSAVPEGDGGLELGTRMREVHRGPGGREARSLVEVTEYEPGRAFALRVVEGTPVHCRMTFEPARGGTSMSFRGYGQLDGAMRVLQPLLGRALKRQFAGCCAKLKDELEK